MSSTDSYKKAVFTEGSTLKHLLRMTAAGTVGLIAVFIVDVLNMFYIAQLGDQTLTAAIGFAGVTAFFTISFCIGLSIATAALVSRYLGSGATKDARNIASANVLFILISSIALSIIVTLFQGTILRFLGAEGDIFEEAMMFLYISTPSLVLMGLGMACSSILRAYGAAKRSMHVTLAGGGLTLLLDPIFIFWFNMGLEGAAIVTVLSRVAMAVVGVWGCVKIYDAIGALNLQNLKNHISEILKISIPALLTNLATPIGAGYVTYALAPFGAEAVSAGAVVNRLIPLAFCGLFALSGATSPVLGQNYGAQNFDRLRNVLTQSLFLSLIYTAFISLLLMVASYQLVSFFGMSGIGAELLVFFCYVIAPLFSFMGILFVANSAFNTLGKPFYATTFNWLRATIGTIPFVYYGSQFYGAKGVMGGQSAGGILFGIISVIIAYRLIANLDTRARTNI